MVEATNQTLRIMGLNAIKPIIEFQTAMFRMYGETCELMAKNCEKGLETFGKTIDPSRQ
jgi:hypothetical protein